MNTTVGVKALTDICCTSSNALKVVESIPADQPVIFAPDRNLGSYIQKLTGRRNMVLWDGACHVHEEFSLEKLLTLKREHPAAKVVVHPECRAYIVEVADYVGSTAGILEYCCRSDAQEFIVVTEAGILAEMKRRYPEKEFIPVRKFYPMSISRALHCFHICLEIYNQAQVRSDVENGQWILA